MLADRWVAIVNSRYLLLLTPDLKSPQQGDPVSGDLQLCHFFETANPAEFAEQILNLQLTRLAALNEGGDSPEKVRSLSI
ncbi:unnamed protein product [Taenia asiatica]|uniref:Transcriptional regulator n=1 Tax=Taenia asiatica TaxID=60517 RepID=A0A0R3WHB0_TAEAS|nr:unnamed protein product [Taenia asiatica]